MTRLSPVIEELPCQSLCHHTCGPHLTKLFLWVTTNSQAADIPSVHWTAPRCGEVESSGKAEDLPTGRMELCNCGT